MQRARCRLVAPGTGCANSFPRWGKVGMGARGKTLRPNAARTPTLPQKGREL